MKKVLFLFFSLLSVFLIFMCTVAFAAGDSSESPALVSLPDWLYSNWAIVALFVSEAMAFLPAKAAGICKAAFSVVTAIFGKKKLS